MITCWLVYMVAYLTRNTYAASIVHLTGQGLLTPSLAGLISTCYFISYGSGHMINGFLADRIKPVTMLCIGITGTAVCNVLMPVVTPAVPAMAAVWLAKASACSCVMPIDNATDNAPTKESPAAVGSATCSM